jgi:hypothetical protein
LLHDKKAYSIGGMLKTVFNCITVPVLILVLTTQLVSDSDFAELENKAKQLNHTAINELEEMCENGMVIIRNYI